MSGNDWWAHGRLLAHANGNRVARLGVSVVLSKRPTVALGCVLSVRVKMPNCLTYFIDPVSLDKPALGDWTHELSLSIRRSPGRFWSGNSLSVIFHQPQNLGFGGQSGHSTTLPFRRQPGGTVVPFLLMK
jgi:hypothetical protein